MRATEDVTYQNVSTDQGPFRLNGGKYGIATIASSYGTSVNLQLLGPDGSTYITVLALIADGLQTVDIPPGTYKIGMSGVPSGVYISVTSIPGS